MVSFTHEQNIICSQTFKAKHSWTTLHMNRPLFVGSYLQARGGLSANEKEEKVYRGWFLVSLMHNCIQYLTLSLPEKAKD